MTDEEPSAIDGASDYTRWDDDTDQSYLLRVASQALWEVGALFRRIGDDLLDAAYPDTSVDVNVDDGPAEPIRVKLED